VSIWGRSFQWTVWVSAIYQHIEQSINTRLNLRNARNRPTETEPGPNRTSDLSGVIRLPSCLPEERSDWCHVRSILVRGAGQFSVKLVQFFRERCSGSSAFRFGASEFPLKARYSGGVWGAEGAQGNRMSATETPGRLALWGQRGAVCRRSGSPGAGLRRRVVGCVESILNVHFRSTGHSRPVTIYKQ
jgi:hypothetical protein